MKLYKIINNASGKETNRFTDESGLDQNYWEPSFGNQAWVKTRVIPAVLDENGNELTPESVEEINHPADYSIVEEDITVELIDNTTRENEMNAAREALQTINSGTLTAAEMSEAIRNIAKLLS